MGSRSKLVIVHEEEGFVLINKPAGLLSVPDRFDLNLPNAKYLLRKKYGEILTVHRLDRDTSGLLCFARTAEMHSALSQQFAAHTPLKTYFALVEGTLGEDTASIDTPLRADPRRPGQMTTADKGGLNALTEYEVIERFEDFTLTKVKIHTGRTHQIRVHFQSIGHPLVADPFYGRRQKLLLSSIKGRKYRLGKDQEERPLLARTALHAASLSFTHPETGLQLEFRAEPPKDFRASLQQLRKWNATRS